jgi:SAM-dependent methyltransferase
MTGRQHDYIVDVGYTRGYYAELNPLRARLAMLKAGFAPPQMSTACELGFGQGVSLAIHAAASSTVWYGNDINPEHVASTSSLLAASGATAHLFEESFIEFAQRKDLPEFDYIGMNGVWSWISDESQAAVVDFVRRHLKAGGVFFINYITLPGWAPYMPLRELLVRHAETATAKASPLFDRIDASLDFARRLQTAAPAFFADNPAVADYFSTMGDRGHSYLAHAYFNQNYRPTYFSTVASLLAPAGLHYVGPADIGNLESVHLTRPQQELLGTIDDPVFREFVHDFLVNRYARRDLWVKGDAPRLDNPKRAALLREIKVCAAVPRPELPMKLRAALALNGGPSEAVYKPLLQMLSTLEPVSLAALESSLTSAGATLEQILDAVLLVAGQEQLDIVQPKDAGDRARGRCNRLNGHLLEAARATGGFNHLASPVTGAGVTLSRRQQLFLLAHRDGAEQSEALAAFVRNFLPDDSALIDRARTFIDTDLPFLKSLGVA